MKIPLRVKIEACRAIEVISCGFIFIGIYRSAEFWDIAQMIPAGLGLLTFMFITTLKDQLVIQSIPPDPLLPYAPEEIQRQYEGMSLTIQSLAETLDILMLRSSDMSKSMLHSYRAQALLAEDRNFFKEKADRLNYIGQLASEGTPRREPSWHVIPSRASDPPEPQAYDLDGGHGSVVPLIGRS